MERGRAAGARATGAPAWECAGVIERPACGQPSDHKAQSYNGAPHSLCTHNAVNTRKQLLQPQETRPTK